MLAMHHLSMPGMPHLAFSIDSRTMLVTCEDGQQFNSPTWWRLSRNNGSNTYSIINIPVTQDDVQMLDFNHMEDPVRDGDYFSVVIRYNTITFKKVGCRKTTSRKN